MHTEFKIRGAERKALKSKLSKLKIYSKHFWYFHQLDKDMTSIYGKTENYPMSDEEAQKRFDKLGIEIESLEKSLKE
jgi:hypothetical protein